MPAPKLDRKAQLLRLIEIRAGHLTPVLKTKVLDAIKQDNPDRYLDVIMLLIGTMGGTQASVQQAQARQQELEKLLRKLTEPPLVSAIVTGKPPVNGQQKIEVAVGSQRRVISSLPSVDASLLHKGSEVLLNQELNLVVAIKDVDLYSCGETAVFVHRTEDGRFLLKWHDEEVVVEPGKALADEDLEVGDLVRFDRLTWLAYEKLDRQRDETFFLSEVPDTRRESVGGQDENLEKIISILTSVLLDPEKAENYGLDGRHTVLMVGPPGCGKTLMARVAASELARTTRTACRFGVVKPSEWEDPFVGVTQRNMRECFKALSLAAQEGIAVLFLDEIEAIGRSRGGWTSHHSDKFLASLLVELDGFQKAENVVIIAATNRKDLLDPALLERLSATEIRVNRPDRDAAADIFSIHLPDSLPYCPDGSASLQTRGDIINFAVSRFFSPNNDNALCSLQLRDGKKRTVFAHELASGRLFQQVCRSACQSAFSRDIAGGESGLMLSDMQVAIDHALERLSSTLSPQNAHAYLFDLPQDVAVVSVEPVIRRVKRVHQYLNVS